MNGRSNSARVNVLFSLSILISALNVHAHSSSSYAKPYSIYANPSLCIIVSAQLADFSFPREFRDFWRGSLSAEDLDRHLVI